MPRIKSDIRLFPLRK